MQRRKAIRAIGQFFGNWESMINDALDIPDNPNFGPIDRASVHLCNMFVCPDSSLFGVGPPPDIGCQWRMLPADFLDWRTWGISGHSGLHHANHRQRYRPCWGFGYV